MMQLVAAALAGAAFGALAMATVLQARRSAGRAQPSGQLAAADNTDPELAELRRQLSTLRHDLRGMLSPALLVSDRLLASEDAAVRRAGEVMIRTVDRVTERLAETRGFQPGATSPQQ